MEERSGEAFSGKEQLTVWSSLEPLVRCGRWPREKRGLGPATSAALQRT